jgi:hypothetical protein
MVATIRSVSTLKFIENEGALFRGYSRGHPTEVWRRRERRWVPYAGSVPQPIEWGNIIDEAEAREMMGFDIVLANTAD